MRAWHSDMKPGAGEEDNQWRMRNDLLTVQSTHLIYHIVSHHKSHNSVPVQSDLFLWPGNMHSGCWSARQRSLEGNSVSQSERFHTSQAIWVGWILEARLVPSSQETHTQFHLLSSTSPMFAVISGPLSFVFVWSALSLCCDFVQCHCLHLPSPIHFSNAGLPTLLPFSSWITVRWRSVRRKHVTFGLFCSPCTRWSLFLPCGAQPGTSFAPNVNGSNQRASLSFWSSLSTWRTSLLLCDGLNQDDVPSRRQLHNTGKSLCVAQKQILKSRTYNSVTFWQKLIDRSEIFTWQREKIN